MTAPVPTRPEKFDLVEALRTLATLADRLRQSEQTGSPQGKETMSRIHEALKRAEQERATSTGTHVEPSFEQSQAQLQMSRCAKRCPHSSRCSLRCIHPSAAGCHRWRRGSTTKRCWRAVRGANGSRIRRPCSSSGTTTVARARKSFARCATVFTRSARRCR